MARCTPNDLMLMAACLACQDRGSLAIIQTQLLCNIANGGTMATCDVNALAAAGKCFACLEPGTLQIIQTQLLIQIAKAANPLLDVTPNGLMANAGCFACQDAGVLEILQTQLLCEIASGGSGPPTPGTCENLTGDGPPTGTVTPEFIGQFYTDITDYKFLYISTGLTSASWVKTYQIEPWFWNNTPDAIAQALQDLFDAGANFTTIGALTFNAPTNLTTISIANSGQLQTLAFPNLTTVSNSVTLGPLSNLTSITFPVLTTINIGVVIDTVPSVTTLSLPVLTTVAAGQVLVINGTGVVALSIPSVTGPGSLSFTGNTSTSISVPVFNGTRLEVIGNTSITTLNMAASAASQHQVSDNTSLATITKPAALTSTTQDFSGNALNQANVDAILAACVAGGTNNGTLTLTGGTNSTPSVAGLANKALLVAPPRFWTVTNN